MSVFDDSDMKIADGGSREKSDAIDTAAFLEETGNQHFNGNMSKAKALGSDIVSAFSYRDTPDDVKELILSAGIESSFVVLNEIRILSVFCAEYCLDEFLPSPLLSSAAAAQMFDVLQELMPEFYERMSHSASFSFYYLCLKSNKKLEKSIGEAFAEMCDEPENKGLRNLGSELFTGCVGLFKKAIQGYSFV